MWRGGGWTHTGVWEVGVAAFPRAFVQEEGGRAGWDRVEVGTQVLVPPRGAGRLEEVFGAGREAGTPEVVQVVWRTQAISKV